MRIAPGPPTLARGTPMRGTAVLAGTVTTSTAAPEAATTVTVISAGARTPAASTVAAAETQAAATSVNAPLDGGALRLAGGRAQQQPGDPRHGGADRLPDQLGCQVVVGGRVPVHDNQARAGADRHSTQRSRGLDGERAAYRDHQVAGRGGTEGGGQDRAIERLAEHHRRRLEYAAAAFAVRIGLAGPDPVQGCHHLHAVPAAYADHGGHRSVQFEHPVG